MKIPQLFCFAMISMFGLASPLFAASAEDDAIAAVLTAEKARGAALLAADTNAMRTLLADDLRYIHSTGLVETKTTHIGSFVNGLRYERFVTSNLVGHVITPDVVVITGSIDQRKGPAGRMADNKMIFTAVWRKTDGAWKLAAMQTVIPPAS